MGSPPAETIPRYEGITPQQVQEALEQIEAQRERVRRAAHSHYRTAPRPVGALIGAGWCDVDLAYPRANAQDLARWVRRFFPDLIRDWWIVSILTGEDR